MPLWKWVENHSVSQIFLKSALWDTTGINFNIWLALKFWDIWEKLAAIESGAQMELINAKKFFKNIVGCPFKLSNFRGF